MRALFGAAADCVVRVLGYVVWVVCAWFPPLAEHWGDVDYDVDDEEEAA